MSGPPSQRRPLSNVGSLLLSPQENEALFDLLGRKCSSLSSAVVEVYGAEGVKKCSGVACLVKDNPRKSYFIRVFDIKEGKVLLDQDLCHKFSLKNSKPNFISFAGDQFGFKFASEEEAKHFKSAIIDRLSARKIEKRRNPPNGPSVPSGPALPMATVDIKNPEITINKDQHKGKNKKKI